MPKKDTSIQISTDDLISVLKTSSQSFILDLIEGLFLLDFFFLYIVMIYMFSKLSYFLSFEQTFAFFNLLILILTIKKVYSKNQNKLKTFKKIFKIVIERLIKLVFGVLFLLNIYNCIYALVCVILEYKLSIKINQSIIPFLTLVFLTFYLMCRLEDFSHFFHILSLKTNLNIMIITFVLNNLVFSNFYFDFMVIFLFWFFLFLVVLIDMIIPSFIINLLDRSTRGSEEFYFYFIEKFMISILIFNQIHLECVMKNTLYARDMGIFLFKEEIN
ncbi:hypothetical protein TUBRATIS_11090 [Tubulinosema ratisbonensis]|uniref:Uncharacterized protein n=1 Tax=Tubulinosema ratisbonensis TaxID=291195 RepID=A0A437AME7_9MICR|nr:hypothetical protein TUBRATIS_11090 [Tubulinosema ratisbonensis]